MLYDQLLVNLATFFLFQISRNYQTLVNFQIVIVELSSPNVLRVYRVSMLVSENKESDLLISMCEYFVLVNKPELALLDSYIPRTYINCSTHFPFV